ncbi:MAG TPA: type IV pilus secretin PilQ [Nitrospiria bacterium]|nr:type IV pilus secretin PilQ [Nitrospiria bacterium]
MSKEKMRNLRRHLLFWGWIGLLLVLTPKAWSQGERLGISPRDFSGTSQKFSMEFRDADVKDVLRAIGAQGDLNIIVQDDVRGKVSLSFKNVSLEEALDAIIKNQRLYSEKTGSILNISRDITTGEGRGIILTKMVPVSYANAKELQESLKGLLSKNGAIGVDLRSNTLLIQDQPDIVEKISRVVRALDQRTPQVMIEARVVEASTTFLRDMGIQWGGYGKNSNGLTVSGGAYKANPTDPFFTPLTGGIGLSGAPYAVNLPANVGPGLGGGIGVSYASLSNNLLLDIQLSAMQDTGKGKILSTPKILTLDHKEARISSGMEILIPTASLVSTGASAGGGATGTSATTGVATINAKLELVVTPHITPDHQVMMHLKTDKKEPDYTRQVQNIPPLVTRSAETDLLVRNGATVAIGGILTKNESVEDNGIPFLSQIPILGWFFKKETKQDNETELMIFITPTEYIDGVPLVMP